MIKDVGAARSSLPYVILPDPVMAAATSGGSGFSTQGRVERFVSESQAMAMLDEQAAPQSPGSSRNSSPLAWHDVHPDYMPASQQPSDGSDGSESTAAPRSETSVLGPDYEYELSDGDTSDLSELVALPPMMWNGHASRPARSDSAPPRMDGQEEVAQLQQGAAGEADAGEANARTSTPVFPPVGQGWDDTREGQIFRAEFPLTAAWAIGFGIPAPVVDSASSFTLAVDFVAATVRRHIPTWAEIVTNMMILFRQNGQESHRQESHSQEGHDQEGQDGSAKRRKFD